MADFSPSRRAGGPRFADGEGGEVVMEEEAVVLASVEILLTEAVAGSAEGGRGEGLGFAAGEEG